MRLLGALCLAVLLSPPAAAQDSGRQPKTLVNSIGLELALIPSGEFLMGSHESREEIAKAFPIYKGPLAEVIEDEFPRHRVRITKAFYLGKFEVTLGQFDKFVRATGYKTECERDGEGGWGYVPDSGKCVGRKKEFTWRKVGFKQTDAHPVVNVTWADAAEFCKWLSAVEGKTYRLPTEAQWEYACRAGSAMRYHNGNDPATLAEVANTLDVKGKAEFGHVGEIFIPKDAADAFTAPVGKRKPNAWGLYDMHGNVWEWCSDWSDSYYAISPVDDPPGPESGEVRARRGGAWNSFPIWARSSFRNWNSPESRCVNLGFRVCLEAGDKSKLPPRLMEY